MASALHGRREANQVQPESMWKIQLRSKSLTCSWLAKVSLSIRSNGSPIQCMSVFPRSFRYLIRRFCGYMIARWVNRILLPFCCRSPSAQWGRFLTPRYRADLNSPAVKSGYERDYKLVLKLLRQHSQGSLAVSIPWVWDLAAIALVTIVFRHCVVKTLIYAMMRLDIVDCPAFFFLHTVGFTLLLSRLQFCPLSPRPTVHIHHKLFACDHSKYVKPSSHISLDE